jgi:hypothetical protein
VIWEYRRARATRIRIERHAPSTPKPEPIGRMNSATSRKSSVASSAEPAIGTSSATIAPVWA